MSVEPRLEVVLAAKRRRRRLARHPRPSTGQNLYYAAKAAFGYSCPNYDILALARTICDAKGWELSEDRFYTGIHAPDHDPFWAHFWSQKLLEMSRRGVHVYSRPLRYRRETIQLPTGRATRSSTRSRRESTSGSQST